MNTGIIVGTVTGKNGAPISEALVVASELTSMEGKKMKLTPEDSSLHGWPFTKTNSDGFFELGFGWSGTEIGQVVGGAGRTKIQIWAWKEVWDGNYSNTTYMSPRLTLIGYLLKDVLGQAGLTTHPLSSFPDFLKFTKKIIDKRNKMKSHPLFSTAMWTSESWLILSATNLVINV